MDSHQSRIFDTSTLKGLKDAERFKARLENSYNSVNVYAIGLNRVQIVGIKPIGGNHGQSPEIVPVPAQSNV